MNAINQAVLPINFVCKIPDNDRAVFLSEESDENIISEKGILLRMKRSIPKDVFKLMVGQMFKTAWRVGLMTSWAARSMPAAAYGGEIVKK